MNFPPLDNDSSMPVSENTVLGNVATQEPITKTQASALERCLFTGRVCHLPRMHGYVFCSKHIMNDPNAPYKQCAHVQRISQKRCTQRFPKDKSDRLYCNAHISLSQPVKVAKKADLTKVKRVYQRRRPSDRFSSNEHLIKVSNVREAGLRREWVHKYLKRNGIFAFTPTGRGIVGYEKDNDEDSLSSYPSDEEAFVNASRSASVPHTLTHEQDPMFSLESTKYPAAYQLSTTESGFISHYPSSNTSGVCTADKLPLNATNVPSVSLAGYTNTYSVAIPPTNTHDDEQAYEPHEVDQNLYSHMYHHERQYSESMQEQMPEGTSIPGGSTPRSATPSAAFFEGEDAHIIPSEEWGLGYGAYHSDEEDIVDDYGNSVVPLTVMTMSELLDRRVNVLKKLHELYVRQSKRMQLQYSKEYQSWVEGVSDSDSFEEKRKSPPRVHGDNHQSRRSRKHADGHSRRRINEHDRISSSSHRLGSTSIQSGEEYSARLCERNIRRYKRRRGVEAQLEMQKQTMADTAMKSPPTCAFSSSSPLSNYGTYDQTKERVSKHPHQNIKVKCSRTPMSFSRYCFRHIVYDQKQVLYTKCGYDRTADPALIISFDGMTEGVDLPPMCDMPVLRCPPNQRCRAHCELSSVEFSVDHMSPNENSGIHSNSDETEGKGALGVAESVCVPADCTPDHVPDSGTHPVDGVNHNEIKHDSASNGHKGDIENGHTSGAKNTENARAGERGYRQATADVSISASASEAEIDVVDLNATDQC